METREKIEALRKLMAKNNLDAYIIPSADAHQSEYVAEHWKSRQWLSDFTGSAGTLVVTKEEAGLWTDGRYFIQAEKQLENTGINLFKMGLPSTPSHIDWLKKVLNKGATVGFDGRVISISTLKEMEQKFKLKNINLNFIDLIKDLWTDRPSIPKDPIFIHEVIYAGKSRVEKLSEVREIMKEKEVDYYIIASLDDIAWLFNIRGCDVKNNPFVTSYAVIGLEEAWLFIDLYKVSNEISEILMKDKINLCSYESINEFLSNLNKDNKVIYDPNKINASLFNSLHKEMEKVEEKNLTTLIKAIKNEVEIENLRKCHINDSVAMVRFIKWIKEEVKKGSSLTEIDAENKLLGYRKERELFVGTSFDTIAGYKDHAAMMHYKATPEITYSLKNQGYFLVDSGGQYLNGTTDITRTIALGVLTEEEKRDFTLVLKAMISLSRLKFLYGATGSNLDIIARKPLWDLGLDYKCGTGHGVGFFSTVHEEPQRFHQVTNTFTLEKGMVITNEPGIYKEGKHGIRIENTLLVAENETTEFGEFLSFETISFCPIDLEGIVIELLNPEEIQWLNEYHKKVYEKLSPFLNEEEAQWLSEATKSL